MHEEDKANDRRYIEAKTAPRCAIIQATRSLVARMRGFGAGRWAAAREARKR